MGLNEAEAVAQAREKYDHIVLCVEDSRSDIYGRQDIADAAWAALIAAVRAECAAKVRGVVEEMREQMQTGLPQFDGQTMCCDDCAHKLLNHLMASLEAKP